MNYENIDIKRRIHEAGLTQIKVAKLLGVTPEYLSRALRTEQIRIDLRKRIECAINGDVYGARKKHKNDGWISVKDRLPDDERFVLVCNDDGKIMVAQYISETAQWQYRYIVYDVDVWIDKEQGPVCWWMPLPEPPKEDEHETD